LNITQILFLLILLSHHSLILYPKRYFDAYSSYYLLSGSTITPSFGMNQLIFYFSEGLGNLFFSTTLVVDTVGASCLAKTSVTQVILTQPFAHTSSFTHGSGNILASLFPNMHTPSDLLGHHIRKMANSQVIHTTTITQATQHPS
jgi:hypothetical protein